MTFEHWITEIARAGDNPRGDFIRDTRDEIAAGKIRDGEIDSLPSLFGVMSRVSLGRACDSARAEARRCWGQYRRAVGGA